MCRVINFVETDGLWSLIDVKIISAVYIKHYLIDFFPACVKVNLGVDRYGCLE